MIIRLVCLIGADTLTKVENGHVKSSQKILPTKFRLNRICRTICATGAQQTLGFDRARSAGAGEQTDRWLFTNSDLMS